MYFLSAHRTIKAGNYFSSLFPAAHWFPSPHVIVFTQKYGADQCAGAFFSLLFFPISHPLLSADPRDLRFPGGPELWAQDTGHPFRTTRISSEIPLALSTHKQMASRPHPLPQGFLNGVKMPVPGARLPGPPGPSWAREPSRGGEAG